MSQIPLDVQDLFVITDFDRTLTKGTSASTWSVLATSSLLPEEYRIERTRLYECYRPIELDITMPKDIKMKLMQEWYQKHLDLFECYQLREEMLEKAIVKDQIMEFRPGVQEFLGYLYKNKIPVIIFSGGIGNVIELFLKKNHCYYDNIHIVSNWILFEQGSMIPNNTSIIHSLNKEMSYLPNALFDKENKHSFYLLLGDQIDDIKMVDEMKRPKTLRVGFLTDDTSYQADEYAKYYDILCDKDESFHALSRKIFRQSH